MNLGIALPTAIADVTGDRLTEWAVRAEDAGFSTLATLDRIVFDNYEPLTALAAAAAVTKRIRLTTSVLIAPPRVSAAVLAKQIATLQHLSGGRLDLGLGIGGREDDYEAAGVSPRGRGVEFDRMVAEMQSIWNRSGTQGGGLVGPDVHSDPPRMIFGGDVEATFRRAAQHDGWNAGGGSPEDFARGRERLLEAWAAAGRAGEPYAGALTYYGLGPESEARAAAELGSYYAWLGPHAAGIIESTALDAESIRASAHGFAGAGCSELIFFPTSSDPAQVDLLAAALDGLLPGSSHDR